MTARSRSRVLAAAAAVCLLTSAGCGSDGSESDTGTAGGSGGAAHDHGGSGGHASGGSPSAAAGGGGEAGGAGAGGAPTASACVGDADGYFAGISKTGNAGWTVTLETADPAPPALDDNRWTILVEDDGGQPVEGAAVDVYPEMTAHGHGTPIVANVEELGGGSYALDPVNLFMPGVWAVEITATAGGASDSVIFSFCIQ